MRGVDLNRWTFDWDLTFAALIVHGDGTVLHRYGGRDSRGPGRWLTEPSFRQFLESGLESHAGHEPGTVKALPSLTLESVPAFAERDRGACIHCHSVLPAFRIEAQKRGDWSETALWVYPPPSTIGLDLDRDDQARITAVAAGSPAAKAGLKAGDRLQGIATATDLMAKLHKWPAGAGTVTLKYQRTGREKLSSAALALPSGWKAYTPREFAWRPSKWGLSPAPGFGGGVLDAVRLKEQGLAPGTFAFKVDYLVTWGENQRWGQAASAAGITEGMIILGTDTKRDFDSIDHFHSWWRLKVSSGSTVRVACWDKTRIKIVEVRVADH